MKMKHAFPVLVTFFFPFALHANWQWQNDLTTAAALPDQYEAKFQFENKGKVPLTVSNVVFSCPCVVSHFEATSAQPGKTGVLTIHIDRYGDGKAGQELDLIVVGPASTTSREMTIRLPAPKP
jgi:hypothetical protein